MASVAAKLPAMKTPNYEVPRFGAKLGITPDFDCLGSYAEPWGLHTNPGADWVGANQNIETKYRQQGRTV